jgi:hypothetical protein
MAVRQQSVQFSDIVTINQFHFHKDTLFSLSSLFHIAWWLFLLFLVGMFRYLIGESLPYKPIFSYIIRYQDN